MFCICQLLWYSSGFTIDTRSASGCHVKQRSWLFVAAVWKYLFSLYLEWRNTFIFVFKNLVVLHLNDLLNLFQSNNQHIDLNFRAINYSAEVYLNGHKNILPKGMFRRHSIDVTDMLHLDGPNLLAVLVYPPDHPGRIPLEGGQGGDHEVCKLPRKATIILVDQCIKLIGLQCIVGRYK